MNLSHKWAGCTVVALFLMVSWANAQDQSIQRQDETQMQTDRGDRDAQDWNAPGEQSRERETMPDREQMRMSGQRPDRAAAFQYSPELKKAKDLIGKEVVDVKNDRAGTVDDLVVDADAGMVAYVIVARGGILGMGEKLVPVPFKCFRQTSSGLMLNAEKSLLDHARAIEGDNISLLSNPQEAQDIHNQFNVQPYWASVRRMGPGEGMRSARRMQDRQWFESGRDEGVYGYGQPGWEEQGPGVERRDRSQQRDQGPSARDQANEPGSDEYSETPWNAPQRDRQRDRDRERTEWNADENRGEMQQSRRETDRMTDRGSEYRAPGNEQEEEKDAGQMDQGSARWEGEIRGGAPRRETLRGMPLERPHGRAEMANRPGTLILAGRMIEEDVDDSHQKTLGELEDLMVDMNTGGIAYAIVSEEGLTNDNYHPVPWNIFSVERTGRHPLLSLDMSARDLEASPSFKKSSWPDIASTRWARYVHNYFGVQPSWEYYGYVETTAQGRGIRFDPQSVTTVQGTVQGISRRGRLGAESNIVRLRITTTGVQPQAGAAPGTATQPAQARAATQPAQARTGMFPPGAQITVFLGPGNYIRQQDFALRAGDTVTIEGSGMTINGEPAILASRVTSSDGKTLQLRSEQGEPLWRQGQTGTPRDQTSEQQTGEQDREQSQQPEAVEGRSNR